MEPELSPLTPAPDLQPPDENNSSPLLNDSGRPSSSTRRTPSDGHDKTATERVSDATRELRLILDDIIAASPSQKASLSVILAHASKAVGLDLAQNEGAIEAYAGACDHVQWLTMHVTDLADLKKVSAIRSTYSNRIAELHDEFPSVRLTNKALLHLPQRTEATPSFSKPPRGSATGVLSPEEATELFRQKLLSAQQELESDRLVNAAAVGLTLDLSNTNLARLPEAIVDIINDQVVRLALSNNRLWYIPRRFSECNQLRYLNIRRNVFREIPRAVYNLTSLEILDIGWNKIRKISKDVQNLTSLRIFVITHNRLEDLPTEMGVMDKLQVLRIKENPLKPALRDVLGELEASFPGLDDNERAYAVTLEIQRMLGGSTSDRAAKELSSLSRLMVARMQAMKESRLPNTSPDEPSGRQFLATTPFRYSDVHTERGSFGDPRSSHHQYTPEDIRYSLYLRESGHDPRSSNYVEGDLARSSHYIDIHGGEPRSSRYDYANEATARSSHIQHDESGTAVQARMSMKSEYGIDRVYPGSDWVPFRNLTDESIG